VVLTASWDHTASLSAADTGKATGVVLQHDDTVLAAAFSPDGKAILTGSSDNTARVWGAATGRQIGPTLRQPGEVWAVAFSPDGQTFLSGNGTARLSSFGTLDGNTADLARWVQIAM
jgi:WD40 repeat protein